MVTNGITDNRRRVVILGAAGRDFHNFNQVYRDNSQYEVVAFTATQIVGIADRRYPPGLAGALYPQGIPIIEEEELEHFCRENRVDQIVFAYSDVSHQQVMHLASRALAIGADFVLLGPAQTMIKATLPVIAVSAVRTGCGKSQVSRWLSQRLRQLGLRVCAIRHPMPYGNLEKQTVQRFATLEDLDRANCTVEEREEYEPHILAGHVVYAGVDYGLIVEKASLESDVILWDGGNNDFPFVQPDLHIVLVDPLRPGDENLYHPGETALRMADIVLIPKTDVATTAHIAQVRDSIAQLNPSAKIIPGRSPLRLEPPLDLRSKRVIVVEDGPTTTHGGMGYGAGYQAVKDIENIAIVDPRPYAVPEIAAVYAKFPHLSQILPAMGYFPAQLKALADTLNAATVDVVVSGTPSDLGRLIALNKPLVRVFYDYAEAEEPGLGEVVDTFLAHWGLGGKTHEFS
ncbi:GTPase [Synechocystis sp. PCC 7339]|uniref:cyclic 2,3-diphosphoglycerate synthase n=1 Tax=Synechocystis sp. PCC 7339 TaxID=2782213 RepID=UPI001CBA8DD7|nr:cyclic 2,3-diphosphoglycerate synthase [Synechocystis sp. PCC 7339]UAJ72685.1 GTPase [Synechocystis sp. PCC 7339]